MRITIKLKVTKEGVLSYNYHHTISSWFYKCLSKFDKDYADSLHNKNSIKGFCFSNPQFSEYEKKETELYVREGASLCLTFTFESDTICEKFLQALEEADDISIDGMELIYVGFKPVYDDVKKGKIFKLETPLHLTKRVDVNGISKKKYLQPTDPSFQLYFFTNLNKKIGEKYTTNELLQYRLVIMSEPIKKRKEIKNYIVVGYTFKFKLECPMDLVKAGYTQGFGVLNSQGFGFVN